MANTTFGDWVWFHPDHSIQTSCNVAGCQCGTQDEFRSQLTSADDYPIWTADRQAQRCPVCDGSGLVAPGFYDPYGRNYFESTAVPQRETCRGCSGTGVVWK